MANNIARGLPMSFSQSSVGSANTLNFSHSQSQPQSQMASFASQSVASTPRATPPPKGSQSMSFGYPNGVPGSRSGYGFDDQNGYGPVMSVHDGFKPQIYRVGFLPFTPPG